MSEMHSNFCQNSISFCLNAALLYEWKVHYWLVYSKDITKKSSCHNMTFFSQPLFLLDGQQDIDYIFYEHLWENVLTDIWTTLFMSFF